MRGREGGGICEATQKQRGDEDAQQKQGTEHRSHEDNEDAPRNKDAEQRCGTNMRNKDGDQRCAGTGERRKNTQPAATCSRFPCRSVMTPVLRSCSGAPLITILVPQFNIFVPRILKNYFFTIPQVAFTCVSRPHSTTAHG